MKKEGHTLYKLIIMYLLEKIKFPLTNGQLCAFFAEEGYTDYFTLQQTLVDMLESEFLSSETIRNSTHYTVTESGKNTLQYFEDQIPGAIRKDIEEYLKEHQFELREENAVLADYYRNENGEYVSRLIVKEKDNELIHLELTVPLEQQAILICDKWQKKNADVYRYLMAELM